MATPRSGYSLPVDPLNELGDPAQAFVNGAQLQFVRTLISIIRTQFGKFVSRETAVPFIYLQSAGGKTFRVEVNDAGQLTATDARLS